MFGNKIKVDDALFEKLKQCAVAGGYSSAEEFAVHVLEREVDKLTAPGGDSERDPEEEVRKRLQGLGYIE